MSSTRVPDLRGATASTAAGHASFRKGIRARSGRRTTRRGAARFADGPRRSGTFLGAPVDAPDTVPSTRASASSVRNRARATGARRASGRRRVVTDDSSLMVVRMAASTASDNRWCILTHCLRNRGVHRMTFTLRRRPDNGHAELSAHGMLQLPASHDRQAAVATRVSARAPKSAATRRAGRRAARRGAFRPCPTEAVERRRASRRVGSAGPNSRSAACSAHPARRRVVPAPAPG